MWVKLNDGRMLKNQFNSTTYWNMCINSKRFSYYARLYVEDFADAEARFFGFEQSLNFDALKPKPCPKPARFIKTF